MSGGARVLVATDHRRRPGAALRCAAELAGRDGEVVLASIMVVPLAQPLDASLARAVDEACGVLDAAERDRGAARGGFDTRLVRARSFAEGVLATLAQEPFSSVVLEIPGGASVDGMRAQVELLLDRAPADVVIVRPAPIPSGGAR
ncbi:MAG: hypothetical protein AB7V42_02775 [Thermoleophilia bacterium]